MKTIALFLVFAHLVCCRGQTDTNLIAMGAWLESVADDHWGALRGRLLVYDDQSRDAHNHARVYIELQHVFQVYLHDPMAVYFDKNSPTNDLKFELCDNLDKPISSRAVVRVGPMTGPLWLTLPLDATVRLRADDDLDLAYHEFKPDGLVIAFLNAFWVIPPNATNDFYLSATFTPSNDHPSPLNYHVWQGTLKFPKVRFPAKKP